MKLSTIATTIAGSLLLASTAQAGTVVQTYGDSYSNSKSVTDTNNVTVLKMVTLQIQQQVLFLILTVAKGYLVLLLTIIALL